MVVNDVARSNSSVTIQDKDMSVIPDNPAPTEGLNTKIKSGNKTYTLNILTD